MHSSSLAWQDKESKFTEVYRSFNTLLTTIEGLRLNQIVEKLNAVNQARKNYLILQGEERAKAQKTVEDNLKSLEKFLGEEFPKKYSVLPTQTIINDRFKPFQSAWQEVVQKTEYLENLMSQNTQAIEAMGKA
ncbi:MAG: hypothetical protein HPY68_10585, partial [Candidatus Atribacteria bacterium]|nr:hypothetical protein [Candidatus Atribacteria bacterium]